MGCFATEPAIEFCQIEKINPRDKKKRTWMELGVLATIKLAIKGHPAALREVWDRVDGKVRQDVGIEMDIHNENHRASQRSTRATGTERSRRSRDGEISG